MTAMLRRLSGEITQLLDGFAAELKVEEDCLTIRPTTGGSDAASATICVDGASEVRIEIGKFVHYELEDTDADALTYAVLDAVTAVLHGGIEEKRWVDRTGNVRSAQLRFPNGAKVSTSNWPVIRFGTSLESRTLSPFHRTGGP